jgi:predicted DNA-binding protein
MNKVQGLAQKVLQQQEESLRFSVTLTKTDNLRLERLAELMGRSKSAFCSDLIAAALDDMEEVFDTPDINTDIDLPSSQEYVEAFNVIKEKLTEGHRAMLVAHYRAFDSTTTTSELARAAGYVHFGAVNLQYARLGKMLADYLNWSLPQHSDGSPFPTALLVEWHFEDVWYCTLHPQVIEALKISGLTES